jgi:hypothetical protein
LRRLHTTTILGNPELKGLLPVIKACCSEDETESEMDSKMELDSSIADSKDMSINSLSNDPTPKKKVFTNANPKHCIVRKYYWRNPVVDDLMIALGNLRVRSNQSVPKKRTGPIPPTCKQMLDASTSATKTSPGLPCNFYDPTWFKNLSQAELTSLQPGVKPVLPFYSKIMKQCLL